MRSASHQSNSQQPVSQQQAAARGPVDEFAGNNGHDPCLPIQADLSAMLDGELDPAGVRRVTVHSDVCPSCKSFFDGIRKQVGLHRRLAAALVVEAHDADGTGKADDVGNGTVAASLQDGEQVLDQELTAGQPGDQKPADRTLRRQLTDNQRKLSRILYELGRNFTLMGLSPEFSREVAKEPMPVPDMAMRGRALLDEVAREGHPVVPASDEGSSAAQGQEYGSFGVSSGSGASGSGASEPGASEHGWVAAEDLFDGRLRSPEENLARGQRLLTECLALDAAADDARIYLGLVHYARGQRALARKQFQHVLARTSDSVMRGFALSNLSNIHLDEGDCDGAVALLLELVDSGVVARQPRLIAALFNLALAHGLKGSFDESLRWFGRLWSEAPHRRRWVAQELSRRSHFLHLVHTHPEARALAERLPEWFPSVEPSAGQG